MSGAFKRNKYKLRKKYYKTKATQEERKRNVPTGKCKLEDWLQFCDNENTEKAAIMQQQNTLNRSLLDYGHATGRTGHAKIEAEMRDKLEDPNEVFDRTKTWIKVRTRKDGTILPSAVPYVEKIAKLVETQNGCDKGGQSLDNDTLSQVFNKDSRGRIRGIPGISKTEYEATKPFRAKFASTRAESTDLKSCVNKLEKKIFQKFGSVDKVLEHILKGVSLPTEHVASHVASHVFSASTSAIEYEHDANVRIVNLGDETVAYGRVCMDGTSRIFHGYHLKDNEVKILVDKVVIPEKYLYKGKQGFAETYGEVGPGSYVFHHRDFLKNP